MAHRGLHDDELQENTLGAVEAAVEADYAVEVDLRLTADGGLVVIHDGVLDRTTEATGLVRDWTLDDLRAVRVRGSEETLPSVTDLLALVAGRSALLLELKAPVAPIDKGRMASAIAKALAGYGGAAAVMTFDPDLLSLLRQALPTTPAGILAGGEERHTTLVTRFGRDFMLHAPRTRPDFVGYYAVALPHPAVSLLRRKRPVLAWTVRSRREAERLRPDVDQIIFEGFRA